MKHNFLSGRDSRVKPGNDRLRLGNSKFLLVLLLPLLLTSCLADILNDKFDFKVPFYLSYETSYGNPPQAKKIKRTYTLTAEDLTSPSTENSSLIFEGWFFDKNHTETAKEGAVIDKETTLYAAWHNQFSDYYIISYYTDFGNPPDPISVQWGSYLYNYLPDTIHYDGNASFDGWYLDPEYNKKADGWMIIEDNLILYAKWTEYPPQVTYYTLYYYNEGGELILSKQIEEGTYLDDSYFSADLIPYLVQPGYDFGGWYTDPYNMTNDAIYQYAYTDHYLHPVITPRTDTPYTVEYYLMDTANGSYEFVRQDQYTRYENGQTDSYIDGNNYRNYAFEYNYQLMFSSDTTNIYGPFYGSINGDGSTIIRLFYYGHTIYPWQFEYMEPGLPNVNESYNIHFMQDAANPISLEQIKKVVEEAIANTGTPYYKKFDFGLEETGLIEIPAGIFENKDYITQIYLPESLEKIGAGAFYNCENLYYVVLPYNIDPYNTDPSKKWYYMNNGTEIELDTSSQYSCADFLKNNYFEIYLR